MAKAKKSKDSSAERNPLPQGINLPEGVELQPLVSGDRPDGFLLVPTEDNPHPTTFVGVLRSYHEKPDPDPKKKGRMMCWGIFEAVGDQPDTHVIADQQTGETKPVSDGMIVGVSKKGALHGMNQERVGFLFALQYTGKRVRVGKDKSKSPMWEIRAGISAEPYETNDATE